MNHYETLGVGKNPTPEELKAAKRRAQRKAHPDRGGTHQAMVAVNKAYETLSDPQKKAYYDLHGEDEKRHEPLEVQALQTIYQILMQLSDAIEGDFRFVAAVTEQLRKNRASVAQSEGQFRRAIRKAQRHAKCIRRKKQGEENLLARVFDQQVLLLKQRIEEIPHALAVADKALEILKDYEDDDTIKPEAMYIRGAEGLGALMAAFKQAGFR